MNGRGAARLYIARPRHPLTGRQLRLSASSPRKLAELVGWVRQLGQELKIGARSAADVDRALRRLRMGPVTLSRVAEGYVARPELAPDTRRRVRSFVAGVGAPLALLELDALDATTCAAWIGRLRGTHARSSVRQAWTTLRALVRYAAERGWIDRAPWGAWRPTSRAGTARRLRRECCRTPEELERLIAAADAIFLNPTIGDKIATAAGLGLRGRELARLRWVHLDLPARTAELVTSGKSAPAIVRIPEWLALRLERRRPRMPGIVFCLVFEQPRGMLDPEPREVLTRAELRAAVVAAGLPNPARWSPHSLRDTFATLTHRANGGDLAATMRATRHASLANLARYLHELERSDQPSPKELRP